MFQKIKVKSSENNFGYYPWYQEEYCACCSGSCIHDRIDEDGSVQNAVDESDIHCANSYNSVHFKKLDRKLLRPCHICDKESLQKWALMENMCLRFNKWACNYHFANPAIYKPVQDVLPSLLRLLQTKE